MSPKDEGYRTESELSAKAESILNDEALAGNLDVLKYLCKKFVNRPQNLERIERIMDSATDKEIRVQAAKILHEICGKSGGNDWVTKGFKPGRKRIPNGTEEESDG